MSEDQRDLSYFNEDSSFARLHINERKKPNLLKSIIVGIATGIMAISGFILWFGGALIHLWTIVIAFNVSGFIAAFMTSMLPGVAQVYWLFESFRYSESYLNNYSLAILVYVMLLILIFIGAGIISAVEDN